MGRAVYAQAGRHPSDDDDLIGMFDTPELAAEAVRAHNQQPARRAEGRPLIHECPTCGPYERGVGGRSPECPTCRMTAGEHAYRKLVMELGGAEVYRREWRAAHGLPVTETATA